MSCLAAQEGHGTQCGFGDGSDAWLWSLHTPYTFNLSLVQSNASGATFRGQLTNDKSKERHVFGEILTALPSVGPGTTIPPQGLDCGRIIVNSGFSQEIYTVSPEEFP